MGIPEMAMLGANVFAGKKAVDAASQAGGSGQGGGKKNAPPPGDYMGAVQEQARQQRGLLEEQTRANRPGQRTPFASSEWTRGPNGEWQQQMSLSGPLAGAGDAAQIALAEQMRQPLDFGSLGTLGTGDSARDAASNAAYAQAASRLDPQFREMESRNRARLLNQGLVEGSEAYNKAMDQLAQQRTDAYNQANYSAIREGTAAGSAAFQQNLAARQQAIQELLRARQQPQADLQFLQGLTSMPGFSQAGQAQAPNLFGALTAQDQANFLRWQQAQQNRADTIGGAMDLVSTLGPLIAMASDERVKTDVTRLDEEVLPGVALHTFRYLDGAGPAGLHAGVMAQDLQRVRPDAVMTGDEGILYVGPEFFPVKLGE